MQPVQTAIQKSAPDNIKTLSFKGCPVIRRFTCNKRKSAALYSEENLLFFVLDGSITIRCAHDTYEIGQHRIVFIKRNTFFELEENTERDRGVNTEYLQFFLANELVREFTKIAAVRGNTIDESFPIVVSAAEKDLQNYIASLEPYIEMPQTVDANLVKLKILELLFCLSKLPNGIITHLLDIRDHFRSDITATVEENITNSISLRELAVLSGRSLSSFRRDFAAIYKMPPRQWITKRKLEKSKELLLGTTMTITDICYMTGFENIAHFSRSFKSQFGCPPTTFRMNLPLKANGLSVNQL
jgi:AraC-like DNA-binding protein